MGGRLFLTTLNEWESGVRARARYFSHNYEATYLSNAGTRVRENQRRNNKDLRLRS